MAWDLVAASAETSGRSEASEQVLEDIQGAGEACPRRNDVQTALDHCAKKLVEGRRLRTKDPSAPASYYLCKGGQM